MVINTYNGLTRFRLLLRSISLSFSLNDRFSWPPSSSLSSGTTFFRISISWRDFKRSLGRLVLASGSFIGIGSLSLFLLNTSTFVEDFFRLNPAFPPPTRSFNSDRRSSGKSPTICFGLLFSAFSLSSLADGDGFSSQTLLLLLSSHVLRLSVAVNDALIKSKRPKS